MNTIITVCFYLLFGLLPLVWSPINFELFEYPKMMLVYTLTVVITSAWIFKMISQKTLLIKGTPLDIPLLFFLAVNIFSTAFSIEPHTSWWGYYSRSNGGLLSTISYILLFYALVSNTTFEQALRYLKLAVWGGFIVALYAIPEHFGTSPSCFILHGKLTNACWVQDVQARVFATLGQPNWLAAYLAMLFFPAVYFLIESKAIFSKIGYFVIIAAYYFAFTFAYSRGATLGLMAGLIWFGVLGIIRLSQITSKQVLGIILILIVSVNLLFGSALTRFQLFSQSSAPPRPEVSMAASPPTSGTQLENGGTESGQIRLIVWRGALEIAQAFPILGSGVETFAYSYYKFRPLEHNLVSEWDFLYNKAHNEFLNYIATTGVLGFTSYMSLIGFFFIWSTKKVIRSNFKDSHVRLFTLTIISSYIAYHIQNLFGFSVVNIALFFYLFPALAFIANDSLKTLNLSQTPASLLSGFGSLIYKRPVVTLLCQIGVGFITLISLLTIYKYFLADTQFAEGMKASELGNPTESYNKLSNAAMLNPNEPLYKSELAYSAAAKAVALQEQDATAAATAAKESNLLNEETIRQHPQNISLQRTAVRTYFLLSIYRPEYVDKVIKTLDLAINLAPTDPKLTYNKALILSQSGNNQQAIELLLKTLRLRPIYRDAYFSLGQIYFEEGEQELALKQMTEVLKLIPNDKDALEKIELWSK